MSTACITEVHSYMSYKCETPNQLSNLLPCKTLNGPKMAPLVEQEKTPGSDALVAEHPDEQYTSTETNSSENNSDSQPDDEDSVNKLRDLPLSDSPPSVNGAPNNSQSGPYQPRLVPNCLPNYFGIDNTHSMFHDSASGRCKTANMPVPGKENLEFDGIYQCQKCEFVGLNDDELHVHSRRHDPYECDECGFLSETPDNLRTHMKEEHPGIPASEREDYISFYNPASVETSPEHAGSSSSKNKKTKVKPFEENIDKPRKTTCKMCNNFTGNNKLEYYEHLKEKHSENGKLLYCNLCPFIALYKHHLEYHFRNHFGSKPYQCDKCDYSCVNRSMLNSHFKSHSDVYQYACKNCQYMTKYLHSLKMHLRKYNHEPGRTLNPDGSVDDSSIIDVHGKRRGPKSKKRKNEADLMQEGGESPKSKSPPSAPSPYFVPFMPPQDIRILFNPQIHNNYSGNLCVRPGPTEATNYLLHSSPTVGAPTYRCPNCESVISSFDIYHHQVCTRAAQDRLSDGSFNPKYSEFLHQPYNFGSLRLGPTFNPDSFPGNVVNQSASVDRKNINEGRSMDIANNDIHFQNSVNNRNYYEAMVNNRVNKKEESFNGMAMNPEMLGFGGQQRLQRRYRRRKENKIEELQSKTLSPNALLPVKKEIPEYINGVGSPSTKNPIDNGPLDLSIKQPTSPETKSLETGALQAFGSSIRETMNRASSVSPKFENGESKVTTPKTNRRKGRAFKLNQYAMENDPISDGAETELEKMRVFHESTFSNESSSKPSFGSEIKKSVPRINFKPTLNATKWNGHNSHEPKQSEFLPFPELSPTEPNCADPQTTRQKSRDALDDCWCPHCNMYSATPHLHECHSTYHSKREPFTCAKCGLRCMDKDRFNKHIILGSRINGHCINAIDEYKS